MDRKRETWNRGSGFKDVQSKADLEQCVEAWAAVRLEKCGMFGADSVLDPQLSLDAVKRAVPTPHS